MVRTRIIIYIAIQIAVMILFWCHVVSGLILLPVIFVGGALSYLERCPRCKTPYLIQGKGVLGIKGACSVCGFPIK